LMENYHPSARFRLLEDICIAILANADESYKPDPDKDQKANRVGCTRLQLKHIKLLQETYFQLLREYPNDDDSFRMSIAGSGLLRFKRVPGEAENERINTALQALDDVLASRASSGPRLNNNNNNNQ
jgi:hypothetical protein